MVVKVYQSPDDPTIPPNIREEIINASNNRRPGFSPKIDSCLKQKFGVDSVTILYGILFIGVVIMIAIIVMYWPHEKSLDYYDDDYVANLHVNAVKNQTHDSADD